MTNLSPNDVCGVCGSTRENHGDKNHKFSIEGTLEPLAPAPKARQDPPRERMSTAAEKVSKDPVTNMCLRMIEVFIKKRLLTGEDLIYIFGGESDESNRGTTES